MTSIQDNASCPLRHAIRHPRHTRVAPRLVVCAAAVCRQSMLRRFNKRVSTQLINPLYQVGQQAV
jgi:hypothetical protein